MARLLIAFVTIMVFASPVHATIIRVPADHLSIQDGIEAAAPGDTVLVAPGSYTGAGNRDLGFGGKEIELRSESGPEFTVIDCDGSAADNARGFIFESGESSAAVVSGFTIRDGYRSGEIFPGGFGAGMIVNWPGTDPTIENCIFESNHAEGSGGGLYCGNNAAPTIRACTFVDNSTDVHGGGASVSSAARFVDCVFTGNSAIQKGGAIDAHGVSAVTFTNCVLRDNSSRLGGAFYCVVGPCMLIGCTIENNVADAFGGGGVWCESGGSVSLTDCILSGNQAVGGSPVGGAVYCVYGSVTLTRCTVYANSSPLGAGLFAADGSNLEVQNTLIAFNLNGEAIGCTGSGTATLECCDLFGNDGGDWVGCIEGHGGSNGNSSSDPLFCNAGLGDLHLAESSPCAPPQSGACGLIGALEAACLNPVQPTTWGTIKASFR